MKGATRSIIIASFYMVGLLLSCVRKGDEFTKDPIINFTVYDDGGNVVTGARISVYGTDVDYANAVQTKNYAVNRLITGTSDNDGKVSLSFSAAAEYYVLVSYFDNTRFLNLSNITSGGYLDGRDLSKGQVLSLSVTIVPDDGNIIFYTTNSNKLPIEISVSPFATTNATNYTLAGIYTLGSSPKPQNPNTVSVYESPGTYKYYAKSTDGCVWSDTISVQKGEIRLVNLSKCESATLSFYTIAANDSLLPLSVVVNNRDTIGFVNASRLAYNCVDVDKTNVLIAAVSSGFYTYVVQSKSGRCVWTGSETLVTDDCVVIPISVCE